VVSRSATRSLRLGRISSPGQQTRPHFTALSGTRTQPSLRPASLRNLRANCLLEASAPSFSKVRCITLPNCRLDSFSNTFGAFTRFIVESPIASVSLTTRRPPLLIHGCGGRDGLTLTRPLDHHFLARAIRVRTSFPVDVADAPAPRPYAQGERGQGGKTRDRAPDPSSVCAGRT